MGTSRDPGPTLKLRAFFDFLLGASRGFELRALRSPSAMFSLFDSVDIADLGEGDHAVFRRRIAKPEQDIKLGHMALILSERPAS